ncbi:MAG TPA: universal stress protein, partial [Acidimicrobiales bacterium]|nr:universal stress protein [Acidimicrobiales bacterium]
HAAAEVAAQSRLGFGVIGIGVNDVGADQGLLSPLAEQLVGTVEVPIVLARRARHLERALPGAFARVVVPVTGSSSSRAAQEVAFAIAEELGTDVVLVHVVERPRHRRLARLRGGSGTRPPAVDVADDLLAEATRRARDQGIEPRVEARQASSPARELVRVAEQVEADLLVVGASARPAGESTFLGHTVEQVLEESDATVAVVISPPPRTDRDEATED